MGANTLQEFLNENMHRNYPMLDQVSAADVTGEYNIPTELIADMRFVVPSSIVGQGDFFISGLVVRRYTIDIEISYKPNSAPAVVLGWFHNIDTDADVFKEYSFTTIEQQVEHSLEDTTGVLVAGKGLATATMPGSWEFDYNNTILVPTTVEGQLTKFRSLTVDGETFVGDIILKEGENTTITAVRDEAADTTIITISAKEITPSALSIQDDSDLLDALTDLYGAPLVTINEMKPLSNNFTLEGADCITVNATESGALIDNPCGEPCCSKEDYLGPLYDSINQLNAKHAKLEDYMRSATANQNILINNMKDMENSIGVGGF